ncbi:MAG: DNA translocase FtsK [Bacilli bacterium]|nr:DNA translocase FtsK [Bacilli bacterium]
MAKKKKKKVTKKGFSYSAELYGIILVLIAILGIGKYGPVGRIFASFGLFLVGSLYMAFLLVLFIIGCYLLLKREKPDFFSTKLVGLYVFVLGFLIMMHKEFVLENDGNVALIFKETVNQLVMSFNSIMSTGHLENWLAVGGGLIGGVLSGIFVKLFSYNGMLIVSWVLMIIGFCLFTGFSILDLINNSIEKSKEIKIHKKEAKDKKPVIINNGVEDEPKNDNHIKITSIDELTKVPEKNEKVEATPAPVVKENPVNLKYKLPPLNLLNQPKGKKKGMDNAAIEKNIVILEQVLRDFKIIGKVVEVHIGPSVAQYELEIASGTRVNKITSINREIALALAKKDVRIEAPIPGKNTVGIEFANDEATPVSFYEIMSSKKMQDSMNKKLMVPLGKSIMGDVEVCEVNKMPHLLIAGTTGSGKSVCVNGIICSILMRARPDEVKLVMVDPKVVELSVYNGIPHLMCPVVTDPKKAAVALSKMVAEMERRYETFSETGTKNIESYNDYIDKWNKENAHDDYSKTKMPYIVVIIDELSDLMMVAAKEVEDSILRITQKARAAGIHLIVATQRPSTEVITGLIKANIPSRISFAVGSGIDSRTILDQTGAEKLLGKGDMLFLPIGVNSPTRIQGSFITDDEIKKLIDFTVEQQKAQYDESLLNLEAVDNNAVDNTVIDEVAGDVDSEEELYQQVLEFVVRTQKASASLLQRKFKIGYNKAARMIDTLEERGVIGPATGNSKPREVLVQFDENSMGEVSE